MVLICQTCDKQNKATFIRVMDDGGIRLLCLDCVSKLKVSAEEQEKPLNDKELEAKMYEYVYT